MNQRELAKELHSRLSNVFTPPLTQAECRDIVFELVDILKDTTAAGSNVTLRGFGTFKPVERKGRTYVVTGTPVKTGPRKTVVFRASSVFREGMNM